MPGWIDITWRTLIAIISIFLFTRLLGKRQITQLTYFEYITGITIGSLAAYISLDLDANWYHGIVALIVWLIASLLMEFLPLKSKKFRDFTEGKGTVLIKDGKVLEDNMKKARYSTDELLQQLRKKNAFRVADVEFAVLESTGSLNVLMKKEHMPITPHSLGIKVAPEQEAQTVIMDGEIMHEPLATIGLNPAWLHAELQKIGVSKENVFIGQVDSYGQLYVDLYDDKLKVPQPQTKEVLLATLKKCEADLELFCLTTKNKEAKQLYEECIRRLKDIIQQTTPYLRS